uniref:Signal recognition particle SRP54 helical bundle domain-containing protein n=1 Tax=Ascaris lumbricoides TaxID=6252 RepID=A0A9J2QAN5_ASCLU
MIDLFTIFGKGGLVLWCFQEGGQLFTDSINELIKEVLMQERGSSTLFKHNNVYIKYKLDNEFELVFLVVYQSAIQLSYGDQLISDVQKKFRDMYKNVLCDNKALYSSSPRTFDNFGEHFQKIYRSARSMNLNRPEKVMRKFEESEKSKKTVASMIERPAERAAKLLKEKEQQQKMLKQQQPTKKSTASKKEKESALIISDEETAKQSATSSPPVRPSSPKSDADDEEMRRKRAEFFKKKGGVATKKGGDSERVPEVKKGKQARVWGLAANGNKADIASLDYSKTDGENGDAPEVEEDRRFMEEQMQFVGRLKGELPGLDEDLSEDEASEEENEEGKSNATKSGGGWFSAFKSLVGNKKLTAEDIQPVLDKMRDTLIAKNVAAEPADKLCQSVAAKLEGKVVGSFSRVAGIVKESIREALVQVITPLLSFNQRYG